MTFDNFLRRVEGVDPACYSGSAGMRGLQAHASPDQADAMEASDMAEHDPIPSTTPHAVNSVHPATAIYLDGE